MVVIRGPTAVLEKFNRIKAVIEGRAQERMRGTASLVEGAEINEGTYVSA
jgi:hypothetical protein